MRIHNFLASRDLKVISHFKEFLKRPTLISITIAVLNFQASGSERKVSGLDCAGFMALVLYRIIYEWYSRGLEGVCVLHEDAVLLRC
jgi:hypothetical protein